MEEFMETRNRHYITVDERGCITDGWSAAVFGGRPADGAVCLSDRGGYQFRLFPGGEENPPLLQEDGVPLYRWDGGRVLRRPEEDVAADVAALPPPRSVVTPEQEQLAALMLRQAQSEAAQQRFNADILLAVAQGGGVANG